MGYRVLITGGCGYIGSHIAAELLEHKEQVVIADNLSHSNLSVLNGLKKISGQDIVFYHCDINDTEKMSEIMKSNGITEVIHCAALKSIPESIEKPELYYENNVCGTIHLVEAMKRNNIRKIIFSSTASVYQDSVSVVTEESPINIINPYAQTKRICEKFLSDIYGSDTAWSVCIFRYFNPIGAHKSCLIGELPQPDADNILPLLMEAALGERDYFPVLGSDYATPDGTGIRDYLHVCDLAGCHLAALHFIRKDPCCEIFNVGTGGGYSVLELIRIFEEVNKVRIPIVFQGRREGDVAISYADSSKANSLLGWTAERTLAEMCLDAWNWYLSCRA